MLAKYEYKYQIFYLSYLSLFTMVTDLQETRLGQETIHQLKVAVESAEKVARQLGETQIYRQVSNTAKEIDRLADVRMYTRPGWLLKWNISFFIRFFKTNLNFEPVIFIPLLLPEMLKQIGKCLIHFKFIDQLSVKQLELNCTRNRDGMPDGSLLQNPILTTIVNLLN